MAGHWPNARRPGFKTQPNKGIKEDFKINKIYLKKEKEKIEKPGQFRNHSFQIVKVQAKLKKTYQEIICKSQINNRKRIGRRLSRKS